MASHTTSTYEHELAAFHRHISVINRRRVLLLTICSAAFYAIMAVPPLWRRGLAASLEPTSSNIHNLAGVVLCLLTLALHRWSSHANASALAYGWIALAWGDNIVGLYAVMLDQRNVLNATLNITLFFTTRYLAAAAVVWRPRQFAFALLVNHVLAMGFLGRYATFTLNLTMAVWTSVAMLVAYIIYRSERETFFTQRALERQRDALAAAKVRLEALNQEKNDLMAIAAHDLRSPLMGMISLLQLTAADAAKIWNAGLRNLEALERTCESMVNLVTRVLDVHQAGDNLDALSLAVEDVRPLVRKTAESFMEQARIKGITLTIDTPSAPCPALHDPQALARVIDNLSSNAIKFTPHSGMVEVRVAAGANGGAQISVRDSGPGITDKERSRLFRKFARLDARPTGGEASSGLGLYITKRLVDAMQGSIDVTTAAGAGATFTVALVGVSLD